MSIINDALKKTQKNLTPDNTSAALPSDRGQTANDGTSPRLGDERFSKPAGTAPTAQKSNPTAPLASPKPPPAPLKKHKKSLSQGKKNRPFFWIGLVGCVLLALATALSMLFGQWPFPSKARQDSSASVPESPDGLHVSGIMTMGDKRVALINDEIYELGDIINGMRIVEIERDKIHLAYGNQQIKIIKVFGN